MVTRAIPRSYLEDLTAAKAAAFVPTREPPPRKEDYPLTDSGVRQFRFDRAQWYKRRTGRKLEGTVEEQWKLVDDASRFGRARGSACPAADSE